MIQKEKFQLTRQTTRERRKSQVCKVFVLKLDRSKINKIQQIFLDKLFLEAKWFYNDVLSNNPFTYNRQTKQVKVFNKDKREEIRDIKLSSRIKQGIRGRIISSIKMLSTKKKRGCKVGRLRFRSVINSIPLQDMHACKIEGNKFLLEKCKSWFFLEGMDQIPQNAEFTNANLVKKQNDLFLHLVCFLQKEEPKPKSNSCGIDFGIKTTLTTSFGMKIDVKIPISKRIKLQQRILARRKKGSKNYTKTMMNVQKAHEKQNRQKKYIVTSVVSYFKENFDHIAVQKDNICGWKKLFGKKIQQSVTGGIMSGICKLPQTHVVDRWFPSTKLCPECGCLNSISLADRTYKCECGYINDRDVHSARNVLIESFNKVPTCCGDFKPAETNTSALRGLPTRFVSVVYETGSNINFKE